MRDVKLCVRSMSTGCEYGRHAPPSSNRSRRSFSALLRVCSSSVMSFWYEPSRAVTGEPMTRIGESEKLVELEEEDGAGTADAAEGRVSVMDIVMSSQVCEDCQGAGLLKGRGWWFERRREDV